MARDYAPLALAQGIDDGVMVPASARYLFGIGDPWFRTRCGVTFVPGSAEGYIVGGQLMSGQSGDSGSQVARVRLAAGSIVPTIDYLTNLPAARWNPAVALVAGKLYVFGGQATDGSVPGGYYVYDLAQGLSGTWASLPTSPPLGIGGGLVGVIGTKVYVKVEVNFGGGFDNRSANLYIFDTVSRTWSQGADCPTASQGGYLWVSGGQLYHKLGNITQNGSGVVQTFVKYDPATNTWSSLPPAPVGDMWSCTSIMDHRGWMWMFGGVNVGVAQAFDPKTSTWYVMTNPFLVMQDNPTLIMSDREAWRGALALFDPVTGVPIFLRWGFTQTYFIGGNTEGGYRGICARWLPGQVPGWRPALRALKALLS